MYKTLMTARMAALAAGREALIGARKLIAEKGRDIVTAADIAAQDAARKLILSRNPADTVLSEEDFDAVLDDTFELPSGRAWVIDPIDGTVN